MAQIYEQSQDEFDGIIPIHFDVRNHHLRLDTFVQTATQTERVIEDLNQRLFDGDLRYAIFVLPPRAGSFLGILGVSVAAVGVAWAFLNSDMGKAFVRGFTGFEPVHWAEIAGIRLRKRLSSMTEQTNTYIDDKEGKENPRGTQETSKEDRIESETQCIAVTLILVEFTKTFLATDEEILKRRGVHPRRLPGAFEARNKFYQACYKEKDIKGIGFSKTNEFPIKRDDFAKLQVQVPEYDEVISIEPWIVEAATISVTSPNWDRADNQRPWKCRDAAGRSQHFRIDDEAFWELVKQKKINPNIVDTMEVQWAFNKPISKKRRARVIRVLKYNEMTLSERLDDDALSAILGSHEIHQEDQRDLFDN